MTPAELRVSAKTEAAPPPKLTAAAEALWWIARGDWDRSHAIAQDDETPHGSWVHALLHLIEGDLSNARYWFAEAGRKPVGPDKVDDLWDEIAAEALKGR
ncbi:MAG: hypothetical protein ACO268_07045 [Opitutales bacterium]|jgi:hypothetical protein